MTVPCCQSMNTMSNIHCKLNETQIRGKNRARARTEIQLSSLSFRFVFLAMQCTQRIWCVCIYTLRSLNSRFTSAYFGNVSIKCNDFQRATKQSLRWLCSILFSHFLLCHSRFVWQMCPFEHRYAAIQLQFSDLL